MPAAEYLVVTGMAFQLPVHPGPTPVYPTGTNATVCQEAIQLYDTTLKELTIATTFKEEMKKQILEAVDWLYLTALDDDTFGFSEVTIANMITHLCTTYGPITCQELEANCASIPTIWTPDDPIKTFWGCLREVQCISITGGDMLTNATICDLTLLMFEAMGIFTMACDMWHIKPMANQTLVEFREHFTNENKECLQKLTTSQLGFHNANVATAVTQLNLADTLTEHSANAAISMQRSPHPTPMSHMPHTLTPHVVTDDGVHMFYCWTHGLGFNPTHTSATCDKPASGHCITATATSMQGGKNIIQARGYRHRAEAKS